MQRKPTASEGASTEPVEASDGEEGRVDELVSLGAGEAGSRLTPQQRAAARRELERLLDKLVADIKHRMPMPGAAAMNETPESALVPYRSPDRCVVQGASGAVSVSWFPAQFTDASLGELQVIEWQGVVAVRGAVRRRESAAASIVRADVYRQVQTPDGWGWQPSTSDDAPILSTEDLTALCLGPLLVPPA
ncbi:MAG TPA: hypothetical protein VIC24_04990 [Gemmatimonadaceae bacterium]|jgi:hypothetical protein